MDANELADALSAVLELKGGVMSEAEIEKSFNEVEGENALRLHLEHCGGQTLGQFLNGFKEFLPRGPKRWTVQVDASQMSILNVIKDSSKGKKGGGRGGGRSGGGGRAGGYGRGASHPNNATPRVHNAPNTFKHHSGGQGPHHHRGSSQQPMGSYGAAFRKSQPPQPPPVNNLSNNRPLRRPDNYPPPPPSHNDSYDSDRRDNNYNSGGGSNNGFSPDNRGYNGSYGRYDEPPSNRRYDDRSPPRRRTPSPVRRPYTPDDGYGRRRRTPSPRGYRDQYRDRSYSPDRRANSRSPVRSHQRYPSPPRHHDDYYDRNPSRGTYRSHSPSQGSSRSEYPPSQNSQRGGDRSPERLRRNGGPSETFVKPARAVRTPPEEPLKRSRGRADQEPDSSMHQLAEIFQGVRVAGSSSTTPAPPPPPPPRGIDGDLDVNLAMICASCIRSLKTDQFDLFVMFSEIERNTNQVFPGGNYNGKFDHLLRLKSAFPAVLGSLELDKENDLGTWRPLPAPSVARRSPSIPEPPPGLSRPPRMSPPPGISAPSASIRSMSPPPGLTRSEVKVVDTTDPKYATVCRHLMFTAPESFELEALKYEIMEDYGYTNDETQAYLTHALFYYFQGKYRTVTAGDTRSVQLSPRSASWNSLNYFRVSCLHPLFIKKQARYDMKFEATYYQKFEKFGVRLSEEEAEYNRMNGEIQTTFADIHTANAYQVQVEQLKVGHAVICLKNVANAGIVKYHRAIVTEVGKNARVNFIDIGKVEEPDFNAIFAMPAKYDSIPPFALTCSADMPATLGKNKRALVMNMLKGGSNEPIYMNFAMGKTRVSKEGETMVADIELSLMRNGELVPVDRL